MRLIVRCGSSLRDTELARKAQAAGLAAEALSSRAIGHKCGDGLLLGFANIAEDEAVNICHRLERGIGKYLRNRNREPRA